MLLKVPYSFLLWQRFQNVQNFPRQTQVAAKCADIIGFSLSNGKCGETKSFIGCYRRSGWDSPVTIGINFGRVKAHQLIYEGLCVEDNIGSPFAFKTSIKVNILKGLIKIIATTFGGESKG